MKVQHLFFSLIVIVLILGCAGEEEQPTTGPGNDILVQFDPNRSLTFNGDRVQYFDQSTGNPTSWFWEFSGGSPSTSTEKNPTVTYERAGKYSVSLKVSNEKSD